MPLSKSKLRKLLLETEVKAEKYGEWVKEAKAEEPQEEPLETVSQQQVDYMSELEDLAGERTEPKKDTDMIAATESGIIKPLVIEFPKVTEEMRMREPELERGGGMAGTPFKTHLLPEGELRKKIASEWQPPALKEIDLRYALIEPFAYAAIKWSEDDHSLVYTLIEPPLTDEESKMLRQLKDTIIDLLDINLMEVKDVSKVQEYLHEKLNMIVSDYDIRLTETEYNKILYYIYRDFLGLEYIEPLMQDEDIEDISCDGVGIPIYVFHRKYGSLKTNVSYKDADQLNGYITKLAQRCGRHISVADPLLDGALPDGSRLQATFSSGGDIAIHGSTFTIRKFTRDPLTIIDLMNFGTIPSIMAAYLWLAIEFKHSILVSGGTASGKTSALNALCLFLHPETKIVSIEDTPELRLPHEHWIAKIARTGYGASTEEHTRGEVSMFDLLRAALRERPEELIVGEVRGKEAYVLFQGMATGHAGMATIHAESLDAVVNRLTTPPINLSPGLLQHLDVVVIMQNARVKGIEVRRVKELTEISGVDVRTGSPVTNTLISWVPSGDYYEFVSDRSIILNKIIEEKGIPESSIWEEIGRRTQILNWMRDQGMRYYKDVGRIVSTYYKNPTEVLDLAYPKKVE